MAAKPEDCDRLFAEHLNAGDAAGVAALYEPDAVLLLGPDTFQGPDAIRGVLEGMVASGTRAEMNVVRVVRSGDLALVYNDWKMRGKGPDGAPQESSGKAIEVVRRQTDGTWKYVLDDPNARG